MSEKLRRFTESGINAFCEEIKEIRSGKISQISEQLLFGDEYCELIQNGALIEKKVFKDKYDMAIYLNDIIDCSRIASPFSDKGLWSWLAAFYFEQICKKGKYGRLNPGAENRFILYERWSRKYRHALAIPVMMYKSHGEATELLYRDPVNNFSDIEEQLLGRIEISKCTNILAVAKILYWDPEKLKKKPGITPTEHKPGTVRRYASIINQMNLTYDLMSMKPEEIIEILPSEFSKYL